MSERLERLIHRVAEGERISITEELAPWIAQLEAENERLREEKIQLKADLKATEDFVMSALEEGSG